MAAGMSVIDSLKTLTVSMFAKITIRWQRGLYLRLKPDNPLLTRGLELKFVTGLVPAAFGTISCTSGLL